jgi:hypothetical protein
MDPETQVIVNDKLTDIKFQFETRMVKLIRHCEKQQVQLAHYGTLDKRLHEILKFSCEEIMSIMPMIEPKVDIVFARLQQFYDEFHLQALIKLLYGPSIGIDGDALKKAVEQLEAKQETMFRELDECAQNTLTLCRTCCEEKDLEIQRLEARVNQVKFDAEQRGEEKGARKARIITKTLAE